MQAVELRKIRAKLTLAPTKPSFADRCESVERAFRRMGINPENPHSVMILRSPSGGRHYYVFLDKLQFLDQIPICSSQPVCGTSRVRSSSSHPYQTVSDCLSAIYPVSPTTQLPGFGSSTTTAAAGSSVIPWPISKRTWQSTSQPSTDVSSQGSKRPQSRSSTTPGTLIMGTPRHLQQSTTKPATGLRTAEDDTWNCWRASTPRPKPKELLALGIQVSGTRTEALKLLAAHLVWFRQVSPEDAAASLIEWAMNPRHYQQGYCSGSGSGTNLVAK